jgi:single-stranded-DNA-specific exonuclease
MLRWIDPQPVNSGRLSSLGLSSLIADILVRRGISDATAARTFLHPESIPSTPYPGIGMAVDRLQSALRDKEFICVWGDFDVDGQTSTALLAEALRWLGARVSYHLPVRATEGHGVNLPSLQSILDNGARLVLTCDTGMTAHDAVAFARERGAQFLISDHHNPSETLPDAYAVLNPKLLPENHPLSNLAGVGVAFKLAEALLNEHGLDASPLLDLVALGLIADVALLRAETRALTLRGIRQLQRTDRMGLHALANQAGSDLKTLTEETVGFVLAPRLNALGRLGDGNLAVELLLTQDPMRSQVLASQIEGLNVQRRLLTAQVLQAAEERIASDASLLREPILMLEHSSWPAGVLGIVASGLAEHYRKPALLLSRGVDGVWHGSARSIDGLNVTQGIAMNRRMLRSFGGHPMAAGLSIEADQLPLFRGAIQASIGKMLATAPTNEATLSIDQWISFSEHSLDLAEDLEQLAPFGAGNPAPVLATHSVHVKSTRQLGSTQEHRKLVLIASDGAQAEVLWWNANKQEIPSGSIDIAYTMRPTVFHGERKVMLTLVDFRIGSERQLELPSERLEVVDLRASAAPALPRGCLIWAEGGQSSMGVCRFDLHPARQLAIWTTPPGRAELLSALAVTQPHTVYVIGRKPDMAETLDVFLNQLAGMAKFALSQSSGHTKISKLAAACAQKELTVRIGLEWLAASGHIRLTGKRQEDDLILSRGTGEGDTFLRAELAAGLGSLIDETAAYRAHFLVAGARMLVQQHGAPQIPTAPAAPAGSPRSRELPEG